MMIDMFLLAWLPLGPGPGSPLDGIEFPQSKKDCGFLRHCYHLKGNRPVAGCESADDPVLEPWSECCRCKKARANVKDGGW